jgi:pyruvate/2-oxoglutarate dehydrogenase complex dihydrolipoamide dehydrogenase (E3) component
VGARRDLIVIGAGMAGMNAAARAVEAGASVTIVERERVGGTCALRGCIPSKALIRSAEIAHEARTAGRYGIRVAGVEVDMPAVADRVRAIVDRGAEGALAWLESLDGLRLVMGEARFEEPGVVVVEGERIAGERVVIATGTETVPLPIPGLAETPYLTSTEALTLRAVPERLLVIGAGPIGLELGQALGRLGARVTMVEAADRLVPGAEPAMAEELRRILTEEEGIEIVLSATVERVATGPGGRPRLTVTAEDGTRELDGDALLLAAGQHPVVGALALDGLGIAATRKGVPVDARLETPAAGHFAAGDVLGPPYGQFTHVARRLGRTAAQNALGIDVQEADRDPGPRAIFTDPEIVMVGMTEAQAREAGHDVGAATTAFSGGKARAWGVERGMATAVVDRASRRILGCAVLGYHAADLIHPVVVAMGAGGADPLVDAYHVHPTLGEAVQAAVAAALAS